MPTFGAAYTAPNKGTTILYGFRSLSTGLSPAENSRIQVLFKAFEWFSSTFQGKFIFQGLFKTNLYIQVLFKPVRTLKYEYFCRLCLLWIPSHHILSLVSLLNDLIGLRYRHRSNEQWRVISNNVVCATSKAQTSLRIGTVWSEPLLVAWTFYEC